MAKIRLTESELRGLVRKIIDKSKSVNLNESSLKPRIIEVEIDNYDFPFTVLAEIYDEDNGNFTVGDYRLSLDTEDPENPDRQESLLALETWITRHDDYITEKIIEQEEINNQIASDEHNEYNPDTYLESKIKNKSILKEENINDFFEMLEKDPRKKSFAYAYYTMPVAVNKFILDENGNKIPNPMDGKLFKNKQIKFNYAETFREVMNKRNPEYELGKKSGTYEKLGGYDVIESGKNGLYMPVLPKGSKDEYSINDENGWRPVRKEEIQKYLRPATNYVDNGKPIVNQLIVDRIARISAGGNVWNNPNFKYKYLGPKQETF